MFRTSSLCLAHIACSPRRSYRLSGTYRSIVVVPRDVDFAIVHYDDHTLPLLEDDVDRLSKVGVLQRSKRRTRGLVNSFGNFTALSHYLYTVVSHSGGAPRCRACAPRIGRAQSRAIGQVQGSCATV